MKYSIPFLLLFAVLLQSCGKKWKEPTHISSIFLLSNPNSGLVKIVSGNIVINELDFNGTRKQGTKNVSFVKNYDGGLTIPLVSSKTSSDILFDIPQGTYTEMNFKIKLKDFNNNPSITLNGTYINTLSVSVPLIFNLNADENIETAPRSSNGGTEIILIENKPAQVNIDLNPYYWFQTISQVLLENADLTDVGGVMTIIINKDNNEDIYNSVVGRIKDGNDSVFE